MITIVCTRASSPPRSLGWVSLMEKVREEAATTIQVAVKDPGGPCSFGASVTPVVPSSPESGQTIILLDWMAIDYESG